MTIRSAPYRHAYMDRPKEKKVPAEAHPCFGECGRSAFFVLPMPQVHLELIFADWLLDIYVEVF